MNFSPPYLKGSPTPSLRELMNKLHRNNTFLAEQQQQQQKQERVNQKEVSHPIFPQTFCFKHSLCFFPLKNSRPIQARKRAYFGKKINCEIVTQISRIKRFFNSCFRGRVSGKTYCQMWVGGRLPTILWSRWQETFSTHWHRDLGFSRKLSETFKKKIKIMSKWFN